MIYFFYLLFMAQETYVWVHFSCMWTSNCFNTIAGKGVFPPVNDFCTFVKSQLRMCVCVSLFQALCSDPLICLSGNGHLCLLADLNRKVFCVSQPSTTLALVGDLYQVGDIPPFLSSSETPFKNQDLVRTSAKCLSVSIVVFLFM